MSLGFYGSHIPATGQGILMNTLSSAWTKRKVHQRVDEFDPSHRERPTTTDEDFAEFLGARWGSLYRLAYLLAASPNGAEGLLQTTLERAYVDWGRIRRMQYAETYVRLMLANTLVSNLRRDEDHEQPWNDLPETVGDAAESFVVNRPLIWPFVCVLSDRQRAVIVLRYYEDLSETQIAKAIGCAPGTVKSESRAAIAALRRALAAAGVEDGVDQS